MCKELARNGCTANAGGECSMPPLYQHNALPVIDGLYSPEHHHCGDPYEEILVERPTGAWYRPRLAARRSRACGIDPVDILERGLSPVSVAHSCPHRAAKRQLVLWQGPSRIFHRNQRNGFAPAAAGKHPVTELQFTCSFPSPYLHQRITPGYCFLNGSPFRKPELTITPFSKSVYASLSHRCRQPLPLWEGRIFANSSPGNHAGHGHMAPVP